MGQSDDRDSKPRRRDPATVVRKALRTQLGLLLGVLTAFGSSGTDTPFYRHARAMGASIALLLLTLATVDLSVLIKKRKQRSEAPHAGSRTVHRRLVPAAGITALAAVLGAIWGTGLSEPPLDLTATLTAHIGPIAPVPPGPVVLASWKPAGTDAHVVGCMNRTPGTVTLAKTMLPGSRIRGTLYVYENPSPGCGLVWAEFWVGGAAVDLQAAGIAALNIVLKRVGDAGEGAMATSWNEDDAGDTNDSDIWTSADALVARAAYTATVTVILTGQAGTPR